MKKMNSTEMNKVNGGWSIAAGWVIGTVVGKYVLCPIVWRKNKSVC